MSESSSEMRCRVRITAVPAIVLTTFNAKYAHSAFGLRYLRANLGELRDDSAIVEFDLTTRPLDAVETVLAKSPRIVGVGVYIWNVAVATQFVADLKRVAPGVIVVIGGPEVSHETESQPICQSADYVVTGEADLAFAGLCRQLLAGRRPLLRIIPAALPEFAATLKPRRDAVLRTVTVTSDETNPHGPEDRVTDVIFLPYDLYTDEDLARRVVYVEASRGCPFKCEFCLSSLDVPVRNVPLDDLLREMGRLLDRGLRQFKFVDRTFNLNLAFSRAILQFFLDRRTPGLFLHFEMIPDRLPDGLRDLIRRFPPGGLQFEVGIQTFDPATAARISRRQDYGRLADNLKFLREQTGVHVHADLIVGLPGEDLTSFGRGFDQLVAMRPQEIQVGILKRLRGTPIVRHDVEFGMVYSPNPPYEVLQSNAVTFADMQRMRRFSRFWDLVANSGNFAETTPLVWGDRSPFESFLQLSDWLFARDGRTHAISMHRMMELLLEFLTAEAGVGIDLAAGAIWRDYQRGGRSDRPAFLAPHVQPADTRTVRKPAGPARQTRHRAAAEAGS
jgi:radical SAM superfamily enzyme YgiQ (UPF0313 family)